MAVLSPGLDPQLLVHCETWLEFIELYASDLGKGGLYVASDAPPPVMTELDVRLQLPEATELVLRARVVQVLSDQQAHTVGRPPGVGLELADMDVERKRQIAQLLEFARWQGEQNDPNASFTRMLLEMSPSLPPAEVGYRLSMLPGAAPRSADHPSGVATRRAASGPLYPHPSDAARSVERGSQQRFKATTATRTSPLPVAEETPITGRAPGADRASAAPASQPAANQTPRTDLAADKAPTTDQAQPPAAPAKASDPILLKRLLSEVAHKHYEAALRTAHEMLEGNPGDPQAQRWLHMCDARIARARNDEAAAAEHYALALPFDEDNREARDFIRNHRRDQKLNAMPFGRYFTKKK